MPGTGCIGVLRVNFRTTHGARRARNAERNPSLYTRQTKDVAALELYRVLRFGNRSVPMESLVAYGASAGEWIIGASMQEAKSGRVKQG